MGTPESRVIGRLDEKIATEEKSFLERLPNFLPHPVALVFTVNLLAILFAVLLTDSSFEDLFKFWGQGLVSNFGFGMQFVLLLLLSYALAITPIFKRFLSKLADSVRTQTQAIILVAIFSMLLAWFNWGLGVIGAVFLAKEIAKKKAGSDQNFNYPLLIAAALSGLLVWESGASGNALMHITQGNHIVSEKIGILSLQQTAFSSLNVIVTILLVIAIPVALNMVKKARNSGEYLFESEKEEIKNDNEEITLAVRLEKSWILSLAFGALALLYVARHIVGRSIMDMPTYLFLLIALGIVLRKEPMSYQQDVLKGVQVSWVFYIPIVFYGAVQGMVDLSGLNTVIAGWFNSVSNGATFPAITVISSAILNLFIPNAGSQWLVEGNSLMNAAANLGVSNAKTVLAFCYGAGWAKLLQISLFAPLLGINKVKITDLAKYLGVMMLTSMVIFIFAVSFIPA